jgi:TusA-related sulfurtransferase
MAVNIDLDVRGLSCPEPVIRTKQLLSYGVPSSITVLADSVVAAENIKRLVKSLKLSCTMDVDDNEYLIAISKGV